MWNRSQERENRKIVKQNTSRNYLRSVYINNEALKIVPCHQHMMNYSFVML